MREHASGKPRFAEFRRTWATHPIEKVGKTLRALMPWMRSNAQPEPVETSGIADHGFRMV